MNRVAIKIAYLGDGFSGSQVQPDVRTVQGQILEDIRRVMKTDGDAGLRISSRTDRGVNALGNVIVLDSPFDNDSVLLKALNSVTDGIFYRSSARVGADFIPRHASRRVYEYRAHGKGMDAGKARECASMFVGEHDFVRFCRDDGKPTTLTIDSIDVSQDGDDLILRFEARHFLWNMVRRISAAVMAVARGDATTDDVSRALAGEDVHFGTARPDALTLVDVAYDGLEFTAPDRDAFRSRADEELFRLELRTSFLRSL